MIAKVLTSNHSGLAKDDMGEVIEEMKGGVAVKFLKVRGRRLFGGDDFTFPATIFLKKGQYQIIPDNEPKPS